LSKGKTPKKEDMQAISGYLSQLEHSSDLQGTVIRATKIRRALMETLELEKIPGDAEFRFKGRFKCLLERCNQALERENSSADNLEQPPNPPKMCADEDGRSIANSDGPMPNLGTGKALSSNIEDKSQNHQSRKRKPEDHVTHDKERIKKRTCKLELFLAIKYA
jgi:hypothetical protein